MSREKFAPTSAQICDEFSKPMVWTGRYVKKTYGVVYEGKLTEKILKRLSKIFPTEKFTEDFHVTMSFGTRVVIDFPEYMSFVVLEIHKTDCERLCALKVSPCWRALEGMEKKNPGMTQCGEHHITLFAKKGLRPVHSGWFFTDTGEFVCKLTSKEFGELTKT